MAQKHISIKLWFEEEGKYKRLLLPVQTQRRYLKP